MAKQKQQDDNNQFGLPFEQVSLTMSREAAAIIYGHMPPPILQAFSPIDRGNQVATTEVPQPPPFSPQVPRELFSEAARGDRLEKIHQGIEKALDQLAASLESGKSDALTAWLKTMSRFHNYSLNNQILIAIQDPQATHVAGFHAWKKFDRLVTKGEKGIMILAPIMKAVGKVEEQDSKGQTVERTLRAIINAKPVFVFDIAQTHGEPLPKLAGVTGIGSVRVDEVRRLITIKGIDLYYADRLQDGAQGISEGGRIGCVNGLNGPDEIRTLIHELAHELLHRGERRQETTRRSRELEAESVAFVVCTAIGLNAGQCSTDYIHLFRGNKQMLIESLNFIREVSKDILSSLMPSTFEQS